MRHSRRLASSPQCRRSKARRRYGTLRACPVRLLLIPAQLKMLRTNLPDAMRTNSSEEAVSVIHAPESFHQWVRGEESGCILSWKLSGETGIVRSEQVC